jgi:hypothetical protein
MRGRQPDLMKQSSDAFGALAPWPQTVDCRAVGDLRTNPSPRVEARIRVLKDQLHARPQCPELGASGAAEIGAGK